MAWHVQNIGSLLDKEVFIYTDYKKSFGCLIDKLLNFKMSKIYDFLTIGQEWIQDFCRRAGRQHIIFTKFSEKLHEIEKILVRGRGAPLDPPLLSKHSLPMYVLNDLNCFLLNCFCYLAIWDVSWVMLDWYNVWIFKKYIIKSALVVLNEV